MNGPKPIHTTVGHLAFAFGLGPHMHNCEKQCAAEITIWKSARGWRVSHMPGVGWEPRDDAHAEEIRRAVAQ